MSSPTLDYFRSTSPETSSLSDDELTLKIFDLTRDNPEYDWDQEFISQAKSLDTKRAFGTATRNIGRSLVGIPGGIIESVGIPLKQVSNLTGIPTGGESLISLGRGIRDIVAPPDQNDPTGFWRTDVASGLGSMTGFMAGGAVGKALKIPAMLTTGVLGAGVQGAQAYDDAIAHGASDGTAFTSYLLNLPIGATEMLPLAKMLDRFDKATAGTLSRTLFTAIKEGTEEGLQEFFQQPASNAIAKQLYDENREIWDGAASGGAAGGILGFAASLIVSAAGGKVRAPVVAPPPPPAGSTAVPPPAVPIPPVTPATPPATQAAMASARAAAANAGVASGTQTSTASVPLMITREMRQALADLGYVAAEVDAMRPEEANQILVAGILNPNKVVAQGTEAVGDAHNVAVAGAIPAPASTLPPTPIEPVSPEDMVLIVRDYLDRFAQIPNPTEQQVNRHRMIEAIVRNPTAAGAQNLAALFDLQLDPSATQMPTRFGFVERPMPSSAGGMLPVDTGIGMRAERRMMATPPDVALENARRAASGAGIGPAVAVAPEPVIVPPVISVEPVVPVVPPPSVVPVIAAEIPKAQEAGGKLPGWKLFSVAFNPDKNQYEINPIDAPREGVSFIDPKTKSVYFGSIHGDIYEAVRINEGRRLVADDTLNGFYKNGNFVDRTPERKTVNLDELTTAVPPVAATEAKAVAPKGGKAVATKVNYQEEARRYNARGYTTSEMSNDPQFWEAVRAINDPPTSVSATPKGETAKEVANNLTPMQREYRDLKTKYPNGLMAMRLGDFYEFFFGDARTASKELNVTLTKRKEVPMAGVPYHAAKGYFDKLRQAGFDVHVVDVVNGKRDVIETLAKTEPEKPSEPPIESQLRDADNFTGKAANESEKATMAWGNHVETVVNPIKAKIRKIQSEVAQMESDAARTLPKAKRKITQKAFLDQLGVATKDEANALWKKKNAEWKDLENQLEAAEIKRKELEDAKERRGKEWSSAATRSGELRRQVYPKVKEGDAAPKPTVRESKGDETIEGYESQFRAEPGLSTATVTTKIWNTVLDAIRMAGIPVRVLNTAIAKVQPEYRQYVNGDRLIIVGMNYLTGPTAGSLEDLIHEAGHALWAVLPKELQGRLDRAVGSRSIMRGGAVVNESAEETIVDRTSQAMVSEGFSLPEARGYAQELWRFIKGLIQRLAMAVQEALLGRASQRMAEAYFKNQMESWLAGVPRPFSIIQFLGGGRPRPEHVFDSLTPANGSGTIVALWDADSEQMVYPDVLIDGRDALAYTSKYRWQGDVSSPIPVVNETNSEADQMPFIATTNEVSAALESAFNQWAGRGQNRTSTGATLFQTFQQFFEQFLHPDNYLTFPGDLVADINAELTKVNKGPVQPDLRVSQIQEASAQMRAATQALTIMRQMAASLASRRADSQSEWNKNDNQIKRVARQINRAATHYTDVSDIVADAKFDLEDIFTRFRSDITNGVKAADKMGRLGQVIKKLVGDIDSPVDTLAQFRGTLERLYTKINGAGMNSFLDMLDTVSKLNLPWDTLTVPQLKILIEPELQTNPLFAPIQISDERTALLGILIAFGKQNSRVIDYLQLRAVEAGNERTAINEILKEAVGDSRDSITRARSLLNRVSKYQLLAGRLIDRIEKMRADNLALVQANRALDSFIEFHDQDLVPAMGAAMRPMEQIIGAHNESWEPNDKAKMQVPQSPTDTVDQVMDKSREQTLTLTSGQRLNSDTEQQMKQMQAWSDEYARTRPGEKGVTWNNVNLVLSKLKTIGVDPDVRKVKHSFVIDMLASLRDKLDTIGLPVTRELSKRLAWLDILHLQHSRDMTVNGVKWDNAESAALAEANRTVSAPFTTETFRDMFFQPALKLAEDRKDISLVTANQAADETATLAAMRGLLLDNPGSRSILQANPKLWPALEQFYRAHWKWGVMGTFKVRNSMAKTVGNPLGATIKDDVLGLQRLPIGNPIHTSPRTLHRKMRLLWEKMRPAWEDGYATTPDDLTKVAKAFADEYTTDPAAMAQRLQGMFTPEVWKTLTRWIVQMPRSAFNGPIRQDGTWPMALRTNIQQAYQTANGDVLAFIEALSQLESGQAATSGFIGETLSTFQAFFNIIHGIYTDLDKARDNRIENPTHANGTDIDHFLMDSRKSEALPAGFLEYATFGAYDMQRIFQRFAEHESFGRDATAVWSLIDSASEELKGLADKFNQAKSDADTQGTTKKQRDDLLTQLLGGKEARYIAERAARNLTTLSSAENDFGNIVKSQATTMVQQKAFVELLGVSPIAALQSFGSAMMDFISHFQGIRIFGLSSQGLQSVGDMSKASAARIFGSFFQVFGHQIKMQAEKNALLHEEGFSDPDEVLTLREKMTSIVHSTNARMDIGKLSKGAIIAARTAKAMLSTGVPQIFKTNTQLYPTLKPAMFTYASQVMQGSSIIATWEGYERMLLKAIKFFRANPAALNDPAFRFKGPDLGYKKGLILNDEFAFDVMQDQFERQGVGSVERVARDAIRRQDMAPPGAKVPVMTREQMRVVGFVGPNEIMQDSSMSNRSTWMMTNPILKTMTTLLGWSITNFKAVTLAFREPGGENSYRAARKGLVAYAALIPIGIAFAMLRDEYDERVLGKKANVLGLGEGNNAMAVIDMMDRAGTFGIGGNAINSLVNQDINREFSLDSRVFFASSLLNTGRALSNWVRQGEATWGTVYRPLISGLGGSAFLQNADVINNAMSLDNAESRAVARISVNNYLRAVGRTLDLDVRLGRGQRVISNTIKPWVSEMLLAAYSNDMAGFAEAYRNAVTAAREAGNPDPADHVKRSYSGIHPLRVVYQTMPSEAEYRKILNALPANGREAVQEAIYRYNQFGERIGVKPSFGREEKAPTLNMASVRSRAALAFSGF